MSAFDIARELEAYAEELGFEPPRAYYIVGEFNLREADGSSIYSDEGHLWCKQCAEALLAKAHALMPRAKRKDNFICPTDAAGEDSCPHCMACGETLDGSVSSYAVAEEVAHYAEHPIDPTDVVNVRQAVEIAQILYTAPNDAEVIAIGTSALAAIRSRPARSGDEVDRG